MNSIIKYATIFIALSVGLLASAQEWDGAVTIDTPKRIAELVDVLSEFDANLLFDAVLVEGFTTTANGVITHGDEVTGSRQLGPDFRNIEITWEYSVERLADNSGYVLIETITVTDDALLVDKTTTSSRVVLDRQQCSEVFRNRQYSMQIAMYSSQWFYDWMYRNYASSIWTQEIDLYTGGLYDYYTNKLSPYAPFGTVTIGPLILVSILP